MKTDFSLNDHFFLVKWMKERDIRKTYDYQRKFIRFIEGEANMKNSEAEQRALNKLEAAFIKAVPSAIHNVRPDAVAEGYWVPVQVFIGEDELSGPINNEHNRARVAYATASKMDIGSLVNYVTNDLIAVYEDQPDQFEMDWETLLEKNDE